MRVVFRIEAIRFAAWPLPGILNDDEGFLAFVFFIDKDDDEDLETIAGLVVDMDMVDPDLSSSLITFTFSVDKGSCIFGAVASAIYTVVEPDGFERLRSSGVRMKPPLVDEIGASKTAPPPPPPALATLVSFRTSTVLLFIVMDVSSTDLTFVEFSAAWWNRREGLSCLFTFIIL